MTPSLIGFQLSNSPSSDEWQGRGWGVIRSFHFSSKWIDIFPEFPCFWQFCDFWWTPSPESIMQEILQTFFAGPRLGGIQFPDFLEATELMDSCYRTHRSMDVNGILHNSWISVRSQVPGCLANFQLILNHYLECILPIHAKSLSDANVKPEML